MKTFSYLLTALAGVFAVLAVLARFITAGNRIIVHFNYFIEGIEICLLGAVVFALYHLIGTKEK